MVDLAWRFFLLSSGLVIAMMGFQVRCALVLLVPMESSLKDGSPYHLHIKCMDTTIRVFEKGIM